uniref:Uncharacterized protein n=1 Tax=Trichogramma kaykai TaxID=54128 RepID=A0ABD2XJ63_9HYME
MRVRVSTTQAAQFIGIPWKILASLRGEPSLGGPPSTWHPCSSTRVSIRLTLWANVQLMLCLLYSLAFCVCAYGCWYTRPVNYTRLLREICKRSEKTRPCMYIYTRRR